MLKNVFAIIITFFLESRPNFIFSNLFLFKLCQTWAIPSQNYTALFLMLINLMFLLCFLAVCRAEADPGQSSPARGKCSRTGGRAGETPAESQRSGAGGGQKRSEPTY